MKQMWEGLWTYLRATLVAAQLFAVVGASQSSSQSTSTPIVFPLTDTIEIQELNRLNEEFVVPVYLNGQSEPFTAYIDTGATHTILTERVSEFLGIGLSDSKVYAYQFSDDKLELVPATETLSIQMSADGQAVIIKPLTLTEVTSMKTAHDALQQLSKSIDIFIGMDFLTEVDFTLNPSSNSIRIVPRSTNIDRLPHLKLRVPIQVAGKEYFCAIDTGSPDQDGVVFGKHHIDYDFLQGYFPKWSWSYSQASSTGWTHSALDSSAKIGDLEGEGFLVHLEPRNSEDKFLTIADSDENRCTLGLKPFSQANIEWKGGQPLLSGLLPSARYNRSGIKKAWFSPESEAIVVAELWSGSNLEKDGLPVNAFIVAVNGTNIAKDNIRDLQELFFDPAGTPITIEWYGAPNADGYSQGPFVARFLLEEILE